MKHLELSWQAAAQASAAGPTDPAAIGSPATGFPPGFGSSVVDTLWLYNLAGLKRCSHSLAQPCRHTGKNNSTCEFVQKHVVQGNLIKAPGTFTKRLEQIPSKRKATWPLNDPRAS